MATIRDVAPLPCLDDEILSRFYEGRVSPAEARAVRTHASECERCGALLASVVRTHAPSVVHPPSAPLTLRGPAVFAGRYRLETVLGMGGMGIVYLARPQDGGPPVAVKTLHLDGTDPEQAARLRREARILATLGGDHVVRILDAGDLASGQPYLVMELLHGCTVQDALRDGPLPSDVVVQVLLDACDALGRAHAHGIVHRDLKPGNLFLAEDGRGGVVLKVLDFGLGTAPPRAAAHTTALATRTGAFLGTPVYMAPEQIRDPSRVDGRSDLFSLGSTAYAMLTGAMPFGGSNAAVLLANVLSSEPPPLTQSAPGLRAIVERCMRKEPAARFASCAELQTALLQLTAPRRTGRAVARWSLLAAGGIGIGVVAHVAQLYVATR